MTSPLLSSLRQARALLAAAPTTDAVEAVVAQRLSRDLEQAVARLENTDSAKDLVSIVCHDLKDPLASIVMGAGFLRKAVAVDDAPARRVVEAIARSAERMGQVVSDFHDLAKLELARLPMDIRACDVATTLRAASGPWEVQARERGVHFELDVPALPLMARCDRARLVQALTKLVNNALRFTPSEGRVAVRAVAAPPNVRFTVTDTGRGIADERLAGIFDHSVNARRTPRDGPGLGLAIVRGLVEAQDGKIEVRSELGKGSQFDLWLKGG